MHIRLMRNALYALLLFVGISNTYGQANNDALIPTKIYQRSLTVGGSLSGSYKSLINHIGTETITGYRAQVEGDVKVGYFILKDMALGARVTANHQFLKFKTQETALQNKYLLVGPYARYYHQSSLFAEAGYAFGMNKTSHEFKSKLTEARGGVGYSYFISPKLALEPAIYLTYLQEKRTDNTNSNKYLSEFGPTLSLGLQIYLYREKAVSLSHGMY